jgi:hypothetical protein
MCVSNALNSGPTAAVSPASTAASTSAQAASQARWSVVKKLESAPMVASLVID